MNEWVNDRMRDWARYVVCRDQGAQGYPKESPSFRLTARSSSAGSVMLVESEAMEIEMAMMRVKEQHPQLYLVGVEWYVRNRTATDLARVVGCHRDTVYSRINSLHVIVANLLRDGRAA